MPNAEERREVSVPPSSRVLSHPRRSQILEALGRKVAIAPSVDLAELANETEGFSGADLQALVYNAHLEVVHDTISAHASESPSSTKANGAVSPVPNESGDAPPVKYMALGNKPVDGRVLSRAEESAFQRRVRIACVYAGDYVLIQIL